MDEEDDCFCEFDPYPVGDPDYGEESWHFFRRCDVCGCEWFALHCPHDGIQNPCPECGWIVPGKRTPLRALGLDPND